jgi:hypothetical protein
LWEVIGRIAPTNIKNIERENNKNQEKSYTINPSSFLIQILGADKSTII